MRSSLGLLIATLIFVSAVGEAIENSKEKQPDPLGKIFAPKPLLSLTKSFSDTSYSLSIRTTFKVSGLLRQDAKESKDDTDVSIIVSADSIASGTYQAFSGRLSTSVYDKSGILQAVLVSGGDNEDNDIYMRVRARVMKDLTHNLKEEEMLGMRKLTYSETCLKQGIYEAYNGSHAAFILDDNGMLVAALLEYSEDYRLFLATEAECHSYIWKEGESKVILQPGKYKALVSSDCGIILDEAGNLIYLQDF